ncbi:hypothetical protein TRVL_10185 [Trypanosoma vivax]|nr:hypothetical protein TRVL_10185 [Trypanosoma vivax]
MLCHAVCVPLDRMRGFKTFLVNALRPRGVLWCENARGNQIIAASSYGARGGGCSEVVIHSKVATEIDEVCAGMFIYLFTFASFAAALRTRPLCGFKVPISGSAGNNAPIRTRYRSIQFYLQPL